VLLGVLSIGLLGSTPATAQAAGADPVVYLQQNVPQAVEYSYGVGATGSVPGQVSVTNVLNADKTLQAGSGTVVNAVKAEKWAWLNKLKLAAKPGPLGQFALGTTAFQFGWKIGSGLNAKWFHFNVPANTSSPGNAAIAFGAMQWFEQGATGSQSGCYTEDVVPKSGFYGRPSSSWSACFDFASMPGSGTAGCSGVAIPSGYTPVQVNTTVRGTCSGTPYYDHMGLWGGSSTLANAGGTIQGPDPYTNQTVNGSTAFTPDPGTGPTTTAVNNELATNPNAYPNFIPWLASQVYEQNNPGSTQQGTNPYENPTVVYKVVPDCKGKTFAQCSSALSAAGFTATPTQQVLDFNGADVTQPADATVYTQPGTGTRLDVSTVITIVTNPNDSEMPRYIPAINPGETADAYVARLVALGLVGQTVPLTETTMDLSVGPNGAVRSTPAAGTKVHSGTTVKVYANPDTAPQPSPGGDPNQGGGTGTNPGDPGSGPTIPAIDLSPLRQVVSCNNFPFGVFCWVYGKLGGLQATGAAPAFDLPLVYTGQSIHVDTAVWGPARAIVQPVILFASFIALGWALGTFVIGGGSAKAGED
jgi:hypothetical protein